MLTEFLHYEFLRNAVFAGILASVLCGVVGSYVVVRRIVFVSGGIAHAAFGGVGLGYYLRVNPLYSALAFTAVMSLSIGAVRRLLPAREDTLIGMLWAFGMALGILFLSLTPGYAPDLLSFLFGNILAVSREDVALLAGLNLVVWGVFSIAYKDILALSFDEEFARIKGRPVWILSLILWLLVGLTIVLLMKIVGIVLVVSHLTVPAASAALFVRRLKPMMVVAALFGSGYTLAGLALSYRYDLTSGATIILVSIGVYAILAGLASGLRRWRCKAAG